MNKTPEQVTEIISNYYKVDIFKKSRAATIIKARKMASYLLVKLFDFTNNEAIEYLPYIQRSMIPYNIRLFTSDLRYYKDIQQDYDNVMEIINGANKVDMFLKTLKEDELIYLRNELREDIT